MKLFNKRSFYHQQLLKYYIREYGKELAMKKLEYMLNASKDPLFGIVNQLKQNNERW